MDYFYSIPVNSDPKHNVHLLPSDLEACQLQMLYGSNVDNARILALDDSRNYNMTFLDGGGFGVVDDALSRNSAAATPRSDCSTRTTFSTRTISPNSDIVSFQDQPGLHDKRNTYQDAAQCIPSGRQSRAASVSWPTHNSIGIGLHSSSMPSTTKPIPVCTHSFSRLHHQSANKTAMLPSNSFLSNPGLQTTGATPLNSSMPSGMPAVPSQTNFPQARISGANPSYHSPQSMGQIANPAHFFQQNAFNPQQAHAYQRTSETHVSGLNSYVPQASASARTPAQSTNFSGPPQPANKQATASLPNTIGNSSTGYQCFSHGCGGRHFSNWGNLVRHHRERQLRSKAGAKPTCPRCGKGFTRSSARDAHVAGLKCVLGRRRRGTAGAAGSNSKEESGVDGTGESTSSPGMVSTADNKAVGCETSGSDLDFTDETQRDNGMSDDEHGHDDQGSEDSRDEQATSEDDEEVVFAAEKLLAPDPMRQDDYYSLHLQNSMGPAYLTPQHLQFD